MKYNMGLFGGALKKRRRILSLVAAGAALSTVVIIVNCNNPVLKEWYADRVAQAEDGKGSDNPWGDGNWNSGGSGNTVAGGDGSGGNVPGGTNPGGSPGTGPGSTTPGTGPGSTTPGTGPGSTTPGTGPGSTTPGTGPGSTTPGTGPGSTTPGTGPGSTTPGTGPGSTSPGTGPGSITGPGDSGGTGPGGVISGSGGGQNIMLSGSGSLTLGILGKYQSRYKLLEMQAFDTSGQPITIHYTPTNDSSGMWSKDTATQQEARVEAKVELQNGIIMYLPVQNTGGPLQNLVTAIPIGGADELNDIRGGSGYPLGWYYIQYTDIDIATEPNFKPIGTSISASFPFTGVFDGGGKSIRNLNITGKNYTGLFGGLGVGGVLQNINVVSGTINGGDYTGGICAENAGSILNCTFTGTVNGNAGTGGIAGIVLGTGEIVKTTFFGFLNSTKKNNAGGIAGELDGGVIRDCRNDGRIEGGNITGGIAGLVKPKGGTITRCLNTGVVLGTRDVGGIIGSGSKTTIDSCDNSGEIRGKENIGGIAGWINGTVTASRNAGPVDASVDIAGGIAGYFNGGELVVSYNTGSISAIQTSAGIVAYYRSTGNGTVVACYSTGTIKGNESAAILGYNSDGSADMREINKKIIANYWMKYSDGHTGYTGSYYPNTNENAKPFGDSFIQPFPDWPSPNVHRYWDTGDGSGPGKWKDLGSWGGTQNTVFPKLYWE